ncbi:MAG TPA: hypothetical protein VE978_12820 [Chitinophagales bacterium]|nr:hypothetical protein [Chitinophagales bacterium]
MKNKVLHIAIILFTVTLPFTHASAQSSSAFIIKPQISRSTFNGQEIRRMKFSELKAIWLKTNDTQLNEIVTKLSSKHTASGIGSGIGVTLVTLGAGANLATVSSGESASPALGIMALGLVVELVGAIAGSGFRPLEKKAMERYNELLRTSSPNT